MKNRKVNDVCLIFFRVFCLIKFICHFTSMCAKSEYFHETLNLSVIIIILWEIHQNVTLSIYGYHIWSKKKLIFVCFPRDIWVLSETICLKNHQNAVFSRKKILESIQMWPESGRCANLHQAHFLESISCSPKNWKKIWQETDHKKNIVLKNILVGGSTFM